MTQPGAVVYTQGFGSRPENVEVPVVTSGAPTSQSTGFPIGKRWVDQVGNATYTLTSLSTAGAVTTANWEATGGGGTGTFTTLTVSGNSTIGGTLGVTGLTTLAATTIVGTTNINATGTAATNIGATGATTTIAGAAVFNGTSLLALSPTTFSLIGGPVTFNAGSIYFVSAPASGAGPIATTGRTFVATFSSISIASGATQALVISNAVIVSATQAYQISWTGATAGSGLSISSVVLDGTGHTMTITMTNATSATMVTSVANITFTVQMLT